MGGFPLRRAKWNKFREEFRKKFAEGWTGDEGGFPKDAKGKEFPVHHIDDLHHGGDPVDPNNLLPIDPDSHTAVNKAYPECYAGTGGWDMAGPDILYAP